MNLSTLTEPEQLLLKKIEARIARVGIIGLGYVGLPLAHLFSEEGFPVLGSILSKRWEL